MRIRTTKNDFIITKTSNGWITIKRDHDNEEERGRHLFIRSGETPKEAMKRQWGVDLDKRKQEKESKENKPAEVKQPEKKDKVHPEYKKYQEQTKHYDDIRKTRSEEEEKLKKWAKEKGVSVAGVLYGLANYPDIQKYKEADAKFAEAIDEEIKVRKNAVIEISKTIKQSIKDYSSKNDSIINSLKQRVNPLVKIKENIKTLQDTKNNIRQNYKDGKISRDDYSAKIISINIDLSLEEEKIKEAENQNVMENAKILKVNPTSFIVKSKTENMQNIQQVLSECLDGFIGDDVLTKDDVVNIEKLRKGGRAYQSFGNIHITTDDSYSVAIHEYMHFIEKQNPRILFNSLAFAKSRTEGESTKTLAKLTGNRGYRGEYAKKDKFFDPYCGKVYSANDEYDEARASEIMSMGIQRIFEDPVKFAEEDREYFDFCIANIKGEI